MASHADSLNLIRGAQAGDLGALNLLFDKYYHRVSYVVRRRLPRALLRKFDSEDIVQETFLVALEHFNRFEVRNEASLINWLSKIAENSIRSKSRKVSNWVVRGLESVRAGSSRDGGSFEPKDDGALPADLVARREEAAIYDDCFFELPDHHREVILVRDCLGSREPGPRGVRAKVPWAIFAEEMGLESADAARMMHSRAMVKLSTAVGRKMRAR